MFDEGTFSGSIGGARVYVTPDLPKMKLSPECPVTPDFRVEMDAWLLSFFGVSNTVPDGQGYQLFGDLYMNPRTWSQVRAAAAIDAQRREK